MLKILVANNHLDNYGGSETWTYAIVQELKRLGHMVEVYSKSRGKMSIRLNMTSTPRRYYDLILINHNTCLRDLRHVKGFKIFTSHGIYPKLEQPERGANAYVAITPEVQKNVDHLGYRSSVIFNGVDLTRFDNNLQTHDRLENVLCLSHGDKAKDMVEQACKILGVKFSFITGRFNVENAINDNDLVVSLGRGAIEAMACGREVLILDSRGYMTEDVVGEGMFSPSMPDGVKYHNYSGRFYGKKYDVALIVEEMKSYNRSRGLVNRNYVLIYHHIKNKVQEYLKIYGQKIK